MEWVFTFVIDLEITLVNSTVDNYGDYPAWIITVPWITQHGYQQFFVH